MIIRYMLCRLQTFGAIAGRVRSTTTDGSARDSYGAEMTAPPRISTIAFDMGGVLTYTSFGGLETYGATLGMPPGTLTAYFHGHPMMARLERKEIASREFFKYVCVDAERATGKRIDIRRLAAAAAEGEKLNPEMIDLVRAVRRQCSTALLTNNVAEAGWRASFPFELFDWVIDSSEVGLRKPDPLIYRKLLAMASTSAESMAFVDDLPENVAPANAMGIHGIHFTGIDALRRSFATLGISV
jgi:putative hydrolase of the HAD superfamily